MMSSRTSKSICTCLTPNLEATALPSRCTRKSSNCPIIHTRERRKKMSNNINPDPIPTASTASLLTNKSYDVLKWIVQIVLPAIGTLYFALASIWGLPYGEQIIGTITAVSLFGGTVLKLSNKTYSGDGTLVVDPDDNQNMRLVLDSTPEELAEKKAITFAVTNK